MTRARLTALGLIASLALAPGAGRAATAGAAPSQRKPMLQVSAAASLSDAFTEIGKLLERQRPGLSVHLNFAGSQQLAAQIEEGTVADVFAAADERWMGYLADRKLLASTPVIFARNRLVVIIPKTNPARIKRLQDLSHRGVKLVLGAEVVPVGHYSRVVLRNLSRDPDFPPDFADQALKNVVSREENVKAVVGKVQLGEADAGMVYRSDVTPSVARYVAVFEIPDSSNVVASYPMAVVSGTREPALAQEFVNLVLSPQGQAVLGRWGLIPLLQTDPR